MPLSRGSLGANQGVQGEIGKSIRILYEQGACQDKAQGSCQGCMEDVSFGKKRSREIKGAAEGEETFLLSWTPVCSHGAGSLTGATQQDWPGARGFQPGPLWRATPLRLEAALRGPPRGGGGAGDGPVRWEKGPQGTLQFQSGPGKQPLGYGRKTNTIRKEASRSASRGLSMSCSFQEAPPQAVPV